MNSRDETSARRTAIDRDVEVDRRLGTATPRLGELSDALRLSYGAEGWGLTHFAAIDDLEQRAVASDLVLSAVDGVGVNLTELSLAVLDLSELVGPNGRTMPGPETTIDELLNLKRIHATITQAARAFGSILDCLAALTIGVLGLPASLQAASGASLLSFPSLVNAAPAGQREARERASTHFDAHAERDPAGWLAWMLELRDAVVHRGHLTNVWLSMPVRRSAPIAIPPGQDPAHLVRNEPHLRGRPWQPDMFSLSGPGSAAEELIWLPEPTTATLTQIQVRTVALIEEMSVLLVELWTGDRSGWILPEPQWQLTREARRPRTTAAAQFAGFDPTYPTPEPETMHVNPASLPRLALAQQLRQRRGEA